MPLEGTVPPARQTTRSTLTRASILGGLTVALLVLPACRNQPASHVIVSKTTHDGAHIALVRLVPCGSAWCESLWVGASAESAARLATLPPGEEQCTEIAWTRDGKRVGFLVNGYQLRLYDTASHAPAGLVDLVAADAKPTTRIARGVTFSDTGAAITFDDCPRDRSGCRPGIVAIR